MAIKSKLTRLTEAEAQAAIQWLENAAVSASNESEQAIEAKNTLSIIKLKRDITKLQDDTINVMGEIIKRQNELKIGLDDSITARS
jgi:hypothetical protein